MVGPFKVKATLRAAGAGLVLVCAAGGIASALTAEPATYGESDGISGRPAPSRVVHQRPRIDINPRPPLYRRCVDWYELQHRPSGTVLYPQMRCWWVRG